MLWALYDGQLVLVLVHGATSAAQERDLPVDDQNLPGEVTGQGKHLS